VLGVVLADFGGGGGFALFAVGGLRGGWEAEEHDEEQNAGFDERSTQETRHSRVL
jgi:hypothetical protein